MFTSRAEKSNAHICTYTSRGSHRGCLGRQGGGGGSSVHGWTKYHWQLFFFYFKTDTFRGVNEFEADILQVRLLRLVNKIYMYICLYLTIPITNIILNKKLTSASIPLFNVTFIPTQHLNFMIR